MSRRRVVSTAQAPGQDSFLDVIANLVGIFLILIIAVGSQAKNVVQAALNTAPAELDAKPSVAASEEQEQRQKELKEKLLAAQAQARLLESEIASLAAKLNSSDFELAYRRKELEQSLVAMKQLEEELDRERARLSEQERESVAAQVELKTLLDQQKELEADLNRLAQTPTRVEVIENHPSPKARKSSVTEIEFRLKGGRIRHVPMQAIQNEVVKDMERAVGELRNRSEITRSVGPLYGFRVHYRLYLEEKQAIAGNGTRGIIQKPEADLKLEPVDDLAGEPVEDALQPNSEMQRYLREHPPATATVTLWVYPDSFKHFRKLRDYLHQQGYLVAARPLPEGQPIGASTKGERSVGQ